MDIKIFGDRNTGTRAIAKIIGSNSKSFVYEKKEVDMFGNFQFNEDLMDWLNYDARCYVEA